MKATIALAFLFVTAAAWAAKDVKDPMRIPMKDAKGKEVGFATLSQAPTGVQIDLDIKGMVPGEKAFHIHEKGECKGPDFKSAGDHYAPGGNKKHGTVKGGPHAGDMMNVNVKEDGLLSARVLNEAVTLEKGEPNSLLKKGGTSLVIHANPDDYKSQPSGGAGDRIVCGVIPGA